MRGLLATIAAIALVLGSAEALTRIADPEVGGFHSILFGSDPNSPRLFVTDPALHWKLRPGVDLAFLGTRVRTDAHGFRSAPQEPGRRTVLVLGDSVAFGWRVEEEQTLGAQLAATLDAERIGAARWQIVNAGVPGYSSFQVRLAAERAIPLVRPDWVVVSVGNNEAWPTEHSDRARHDAGRWRRRVLSWLEHSRLLVWLHDRVGEARRQRFTTEDFGRAGPRVGAEAYLENLSAILAQARRAGARALIVAPPLNLYQPPTRLQQLIGSEDAASALWSVTMTRLRAGEIDDALAAIDSALAEAPDRFDLVWLRGFALSLRGDREVGEQWLARAFDRHPFPSRMRPAYRSALLAWAERNDVSTVDGAHVLDAAAPAPPPAGLVAVYLDECHPTARGHGVIAAAVAEQIRARER